MKEKERNLEEVREIGIVAATLGLKIGEVLKFRSDHQCEVHHFSLPLSLSDTVTLLFWVFEALDWNQWIVLDNVRK